MKSRHISDSYYFYSANALRFTNPNKLMHFVFVSFYTTLLEVLEVLQIAEDKSRWWINLRQMIIRV